MLTKSSRNLGTHFRCFQHFLKFDKKKVISSFFLHRETKPFEIKYSKTTILQLYLLSKHLLDE